jgi:hypothetical protein
MGPTSSPLASGEPSARLGRAQPGFLTGWLSRSRVCQGVPIAENRTPRHSIAPHVPGGRLVELKPSALLKSRFRNPLNPVLIIA